jgi:large subunit ribosomal protein L22
MSKPSAPRRLDDSEALASMRGLRTSARKLNLVARTIRGKTASSALAELTFSPRLFVKEATVGRAFVLKRFHTRGRGRSARVEKHFAHLTVIVRERSEGAIEETG